MHKRLVPFLLAAAALCAGAALALPVPGYVYPCSLQVGTSTRIIVGGDHIRGVTGAFFTGDGVKVSRIVAVPGFPRASGKTEVPFAREWLYDILAGDRSKRELPPEATDPQTDWYHCSWWEHMDERDDLELQIICRFWHTPENYPQPTPALDQLVILDVDVDASATPGLRQLMVYDDSSISAPHPFFITKEPHVAEPSFVIPMDEQKKLSRPHILHIPPNLPVQKPPVVIDGQAWPGEVDEFRIQLTKGKRFTFEMIARELMPYQGDAVPGFFNPVMRLVDPKGKEIAYEDDFYYLPDPILSIIAPADGVYTLKIHDNLYRGRQDCVYIVRCYEDSLLGHSFTPQNRAFVCFPPPAAHVPPAAGDGVDVRTGVIDCPGRTIRHDFTVQEPITMNFELFARRAGSPLDGVIRLYGPLAPSQPVNSAPLLAEWDDVDKFLAGTIPQAIADPCGSWTFLKAGNYCVTVSDQYAAGSDYNSYSLCIAKRQPDFEIYADNSSMLLQGNTAKTKVRVIRHNGFTGELTLESNDDFECDYSISGEPGVPEEVVFTAKKNDWSGLKCTQFFASAVVGPDKKRIVRRVTPTDPAEQAFAYTHLVPQRTFYIFKPDKN